MSQRFGKPNYYYQDYMLHVSFNCIRKTERIGEHTRAKQISMVPTHNRQRKPSNGH